MLRSSLSFEGLLSVLSVFVFGFSWGKKKIVEQRYGFTWTFNAASPLAEELLREKDA